MRRLVPHSTGDPHAKSTASRLEFFRDDDFAWRWLRSDLSGHELERSERKYPDLPDAIQDAYGYAKGVAKAEKQAEASDLVP